jgi:hypothetical protein
MQWLNGVDRITPRILIDVGGLYLTVICSSSASGLQGCEAALSYKSSHPRETVDTGEYLMIIVVVKYNWLYITKHQFLISNNQLKVVYNCVVLVFVSICTSLQPDI